MRTVSALVAAGVLAVSIPAQAAPLTAQQQSDIDASVGEWLAQTGVPSVSIAVANGGEIAYAKAYGSARLAPKESATPQTRYAIDSISKEFTAAAMLKLQEEGKLSLNDKVAKYFPDLAGADQVTIRQILSHTAGYRDYWPQDYVTREMGRPTDIPGPAGRMGQEAAGFRAGHGLAVFQHRLRHRRRHRREGLGPAPGELPEGPCLRAPAHGGRHRRRPGPRGRRGLHPLGRGARHRVAQKEGAGWLYAAGELAMAPSELVKWDISLMNRSLLKPTSYDAFYTPIKLTSGRDTHYSAGLNVRGEGEGLTLSHGGGGSGFLSSNFMWPAQKVAIAAFTNSDWARPDDVAARVAFIVVKPTAAEARARAVFRDFQDGRIDRSLFTDNGNAYLTSAVLADQKTGLAPLARPGPSSSGASRPAAGSTPAPGGSSPPRAR